MQQQGSIWDWYPKKKKEKNNQALKELNNNNPLPYYKLKYTIIDFNSQYSIKIFYLLSFGCIFHMINLQLSKKKKKST